MEIIGEERGRVARALDWLDATRAELVGLGVLLVGAVVLTGVLVWSAVGRPALPTVASSGDAAAGEAAEGVGSPAGEHGGDDGPGGADGRGGLDGDGAHDGHDGHEGHDGHGDHGGHGAGPDLADADADADATEGEDTGPAAADGEVTVHVAGHVADPGVVTLPAGSRVTDAVAAAGGATEQADLSRVNLARPLVDGEHVRIVDEEEDQPPGTDGPATADTGGAEGDGAPVGPVDVNRADATELQTLPGIGPSLAERIIAHRESHGPFQQPGDLRDVSGIGEVRFQELADRVTVG